MLSLANEMGRGKACQSRKDPLQGPHIRYPLLGGSADREGASIPWAPGVKWANLICRMHSARLRDASSLLLRQNLH